MALFKSLFGGGDYLGVDIGTTSIKVVELQGRKKGKAKLKNYGILESYKYLKHFNDALQTSSLKLLETETADYLNKLLDKADIKATKVIASLPAFSGFTTLIELPVSSESEIADAIKYQARQYVPLPLSSVSIDWVRIGQTREGDLVKQQVFLIAMLKEHIERYQKIFQLAGRKLVGFEIEGLSLARALTTGINEPALAIDIGARSTSLSISQNGLLKFVGQTDFAGGSLTQVLSTGLNVNAQRAEQLKKQSGLEGVSGAQELSTLIKPLLDVIINEAGRVKNNYESAYKEDIKRVILTGGGSRLNGIEDYITSKLNIAVEKGNPFANLEYPVELQPFLNDLNVSLATAIGAGLKWQTI